MNHQQEVHQLDYSYTGKLDVPQHIVVVVVGHYVVCIGRDGTVHELVVIGVGIDEVEAVVRGDEGDVWAPDDGGKNELCRFTARKASEDFLILFKYLGGDTQRIAPLHNGEPHIVVCTSGRCALYEAVGVEYDAHELRGYLLFFGLLFAEPLVEVHAVDLVKPLLVESTSVPKVLQVAVEAFEVIVGNELLDVVKLLLAPDTGKNVEQIELSLVEHSGLSVDHIFSRFGLRLQK